MTKESDNTHIDELDRFKYPACSTSIDRYVFANGWTKGKTVLQIHLKKMSLRYVLL